MTIEITVKTTKNEMFTYEVPNDILVNELKARVKQSTAIPEDRQRLIYRGHVLKNECPIHDYKIEHGHTIHMVAKPPDYEELQSRVQESTQAANSSTASTRPASLGSSLSSFLALSALMDSSVNGSTAPATVNRPEEPRAPNHSLEALRQCLLTMNTLLISNQVTQETGNIMSLHKYYIGQWLDVKDTINQWLEATVLDINEAERKIYIQYNGWPVRWNEWLPFDSPRIALFRTKTANSTTSSACPEPAHVLATAPITGRDDVRVIFPELLSMMRQLEPLLLAANNISSQSLEESPQGYDFTPSVQTLPNSAHSYPWPHRAPPSSNSNNEDETNHPSQYQLALVNAATQLTPLFDRFGRVLIDFSNHLKSFVDANSPPSPQNPLPSGGLQSLRPPSPPVNYSAPVNFPRQNNNGLLGNIFGQGDSHVDIHVHAILTPFSRSSLDRESEVPHPSEIFGNRPVRSRSPQSMSNSRSLHREDTIANMLPTQESETRTDEEASSQNDSRILRSSSRNNSRNRETKAHNTRSRVREQQRNQTFRREYQVDEQDDVSDNDEQEYTTRQREVKKRNLVDASASAQNKFPVHSSAHPLHENSSGSLRQQETSRINSSLTPEQQRRFAEFDQSIQSSFSSQMLEQRIRSLEESSESDRDRHANIHNSMDVSTGEPLMERQNHEAAGSSNRRQSNHNNSDNNMSQEASRQRSNNASSFMDRVRRSFSFGNNK